MKCFLFLFFITCETICNAQAKHNVLIYKQIDSVLTTLQQRNKASGDLLIAENGKIVVDKSYGFANRETHSLLNENSLFELASISKQFTATAIMLLHERGKLNYDDKLVKYIPKLPYKNITIYQLLTHTSGLPNYEDMFDKNWDKNKIAFNKDLIEMLVKENAPLHFTPGEKMEYSNTAFALLASVIEKISGETYNQFLQYNIFNPLNMTRTRVYNTRRSKKDTIENYAYGYVYADSLKRFILPDSLPENNDVIYLDGIVGDGCVNSTVIDLFKWDQALRNGKFLKPESLKLVCTKAKFNNGSVAYMQDDSASKKEYFKLFG
jgi:CubicO group peptidase (beta-lactamase class C family)